jgi:hypothetical protein
LPAAPPAYASPNYGYGGGYAPQPVYAARRTSGMAIAGFVLSFFCSVLGLIFSILGYNECKRSNGTVEGQGLAMAGIIISIVSLALGVIYIIFVAAVVGSHGDF